MNSKHVAMLAVLGLAGAANAVAAAEPSVAAVAHILTALLSPLALWLGMTSPKAGQS